MNTNLHDKEHYFLPPESNKLVIKNNLIIISSNTKNLRYSFIYNEALTLALVVWVLGSTLFCLNVKIQFLFCNTTHFS